MSPRISRWMQFKDFSISLSSFFGFDFWVQDDEDGIQKCLKCQVRDGMRFVEVVLNEPGKNVVALADAYFFPPYQPMLFRSKAGNVPGAFGPMYPLQLPPRQARLVVYNKKTNETSVWLVELSEVHATARSGHHRGKVLSSVVVPDVQPPMVSQAQELCIPMISPFTSTMLCLISIHSISDGLFLQSISEGPFPAIGLRRSFPAICLRGSFPLQKESENSSSLDNS